MPIQLETTLQKMRRFLDELEGENMILKQKLRESVYWLEQYKNNSDKLGVLLRAAVDMIIAVENDAMMEAESGRKLRALKRTNEGQLIRQLVRIRREEVSSSLPVANFGEEAASLFQDTQEVFPDTPTRRIDFDTETTSDSD
ncbi:MAG: hypothetical protein ACKPIH_24615 [Microcystis panniformis]